MIRIRRSLFGRPVTARITLLTRDLHVLLTGGSLPHIGAVSVYSGGMPEGAIQPDGHREQLLTDRWAEALSRQFDCRVAVVGGVHYDALRPDQIGMVVTAADEMLNEAIRVIAAMKKEEVENEQGK